MKRYKVGVILMNEIWKDIKGFEGIYQISNLGKVKSLSRNYKHNMFGRETIIKKSKERILTINKKSRL